MTFEVKTRIRVEESEYKTTYHPECVMLDDQGYGGGWEDIPGMYKRPARMDKPYLEPFSHNWAEQVCKVYTKTLLRIYEEKQHELKKKVYYI